jgi:hypothetical protein
VTSVCLAATPETNEWLDALRQLSVEDLLLPLLPGFVPFSANGAGSKEKLPEAT